MGAFDWLTDRTHTAGLRGRKLRVYITLTAVTGFSLFGYDQGLMSGLITAPQFNDEFPATKGHSTIQGGVTSCYELGCFFGALFALFRGDKIGRRPLIIVGALIIILGTIISVAPVKPHWPLGQFVVGRVITGIGNGMNTATIPVWQSEMSRAENRGRLVNMEGAVVAVGTFIAYWLDFGLSYVDSSVSWRLPVAVQILFALFLLIGILKLPESPRWLIAHDRKPEAFLILAALKDLAPEDDEIIAEATVIQDAVNRFARVQLSIKDVFSGGKSQHFQRILIGSSSQFFQQFTGCNAAIYYSTVLFEETIGLERRLSLILGGVFATIYALATIPSFFLIDTLGRRNLFLIGATGQGISFTITFACLIDNTKNNAKGAAVGIFLFIVFFAFTILPLPWIYPPEINPMRTRTIASAISTCTNWICNFAVVMFTPVFIANARWGAYLFFAAVNYAFIPVIFFFYPETAGRSLEEIDIIFAKAHIDGRQPWRVAATMPKLSIKDIEDQGNQLGIYDDDFEKEKFDTNENPSSSSTNDAKESNEGPLIGEPNNKPTEV
ncbi:general substrate transporter [Suhomyces tanzawaensis NRRL Y-17324]|uniref:General substrate transporter n=1 Tax=Suhomyces tanzawaensis NRRL Y-17324 TaxID=984487 RepID=A0A1E4SCU8_9ASCO|nr:general substrate transporter [Suhomyces tanzawaensis NRRL Y-17324]ODV77325.1 general substrate transporter [Suhomyces tanzawaensis NRRL Y-17324]